MSPREISARWTSTTSRCAARSSRPSPRRRAAARGRLRVARRAARRRARRARRRPDGAPVRHPHRRRARRRRRPHLVGQLRVGRVRDRRRARPARRDDHRPGHHARPGRRRRRLPRARPRRATGGTTSASPERRCGSSGPGRRSPRASWSTCRRCARSRGAGTATAWTPDWRPRTREQSQAILDAVGLTGDFWRLPLVDDDADGDAVTFPFSIRKSVTRLPAAKSPVWQERAVPTPSHLTPLTWPAPGSRSSRRRSARGQVALARWS